jgi:ResB-like family
MIKFLSSSRITVACLFLLFILTFWGTIAQVQQGLYAAQDRFFNSFFFLAGGFIPFPGAQLILWIFFVNLICSLIVTFKKYAKWENAGLLIIHLGLILYFVAAFMIFHVSQESFVHLAEGESTNVSTSYQAWELAYWKGEGNEREVTSFDTKNFKPGFQIPFEDKNFILTVNNYYLNCDAFSDTSVKSNSVTLNATGITFLTQKPINKEREQNTVGGVFDLKVNNKSYTLILYGAETQATPVAIAGQNYYFILRHQHSPLPFTIRLDHFKAQFHPGTDMAKSYESLVTITTGTLARQLRIYMNNPLRYKDYTVYQASYDSDSATGKQYSTLAVVKNFARVMPYIACFAVFFGLALHFLIQAFIFKARA